MPVGISQELLKPADSHPPASSSLMPDLRRQRPVPSANPSFRYWPQTAALVKDHFDISLRIHT
jgi:hypothetical protein